VSRRVRLSLWIAGGAAVAVALALLSLYLAAQYEPAFYREAVKVDPVQQHEASDQMLQRTTALVSTVGKKDHWEALFTAQQINGWLAVDLVKNHPNALPPMVSAPRVAIDSKQITIACRCDWNGTNSVLSLTVEPYVSEPNVVNLRIVRARAGLLPMPLGQVLDHISAAAHDMHFRLKWLRAGSDPVARLSLPPSDDDPVVQIDTLRLGEGEIYVAGTTLRRKP
jgi:hypothetical protein